MPEPIPFPCGLAQLTVVRHGQSTANVLFARAAETGDARASLDCADARVPLSALGARQAGAVGRRLAGLAVAGRPDVVVCSPYRRALQTWDEMVRTARESGYAPPPAWVDERLRDRERGVLELLSPAAVRARTPEEAARAERAGAWWYRPPGGESLADVTLRVRDFLTELRDAAAGRRVMLVAHDAVVMAVRHVLAGLGSPVPDSPPVANASISRWDGDGRSLRLAEFGSTAHLS